MPELGWYQPSQLLQWVAVNEKCWDTSFVHVLSINGHMLVKCLWLRQELKSNIEPCFFSYNYILMRALAACVQSSDVWLSKPEVRNIFSFPAIYLQNYNFYWHINLCVYVFFRLSSAGDIESQVSAANKSSAAHNRLHRSTSNLRMAVPFSSHNPSDNHKLQSASWYWESAQSTGLNHKYLPPLRRWTWSSLI